MEKDNSYVDIISHMTNSPLYLYVSILFLLNKKVGFQFFGQF